MVEVVRERRVVVCRSVEIERDKRLQLPTDSSSEAWRRYNLGLWSLCTCGHLDSTIPARAANKLLSPAPHCRTVTGVTPSDVANNLSLPRTQKRARFRPAATSCETRAHLGSVSPQLGGAADTIITTRLPRHHDL